jgi:microcystin-dependent protein
MPQGADLAADAGVGALTITVTNPVDFDEFGGTLAINGVQYDYDTVDMDAAVITLSQSTTAAATAGDWVNVIAGGVVAIDYVAFVSLGDGDELEVPIAYAERDLWPEGDYDSPVLVELADDLESIVSVPGRTPLRDGTFINPSTLPTPTIPPSDGLVPTNAPTNVVVTGGIGALMIRWTPIANHDPVTYDLHVWPVSGFTPSASTLVVSTAGSSHTLRLLGTGYGTPPDQTLQYDTTYFVRVIARDLDGAGPASAEASGQLVRINSPDIAAESITGDHIQGGTITGDLLATDVVLASTISTGNVDDNGNIVGARIDLGPDGLKGYAQDGHQVLNFPTDPSDDAYIEAHMHMLSADVDDHLTLNGVNNAVSASASILLASGVTAPTSPPNIATSYDTVQLDTHTKIDGGSGSFGSIALDPTQIVSLVWDQAFSVWQVFQQRSNGFRLWRFNPDGSIAPQSGSTAVVDWVGSYLQTTGCRGGWLFNFNGTWYLWDTIVGGGRYGIVPNSWIINTGQTPFLSFDESAQSLMLCQSPTGNSPKTMQVRRLHTVAYVGGNAQNCVSDSITTLPSGMGRTHSLTSCFYGAADFGTARYVVTNDTQLHVYVSTATTWQNGASTFQEWTQNGAGKGMHWDGSNFWSVDATGLLTKYTTWTWPTEPSTIWIGTSAYDSDATGGNHETPVGTFASLDSANVRRAKLSITVPPTQDAGGTDDPDVWRVYFARTSGAVPTASSLKLQAGIGSPTASTSTVMSADATGVAPVGGVFGQTGAVNNFPAGNPAKITDGAGNTMIDASGHGLVGIPGEVRMYAGAAAPVGWLLCDGSSLVRTAYPTLFAAIGTMFGLGSNSPVGTTFNLPDMRSRLPLGVGLAASLGQTEGGVQSGNAIAGNPPPDDSTRSDRWSHNHWHNAQSPDGTLSNSNVSHVGNTTGAGGSTQNRVSTLDGSVQGSHTHNITGHTATASGIVTGTVHAYSGLNYIIRT